MKKILVLPILVLGSLMLAGCSIRYEPGTGQNNQEMSDAENSSEAKGGTVEIEDVCSSIQVESDIADIQLKKGDRFEMEYSIWKDNVLNWKIEDGKLLVKEEPKKKFGLFFHFGVVPDSYIVLTIPEQKWEKIAAVSDTGNVFVEGLSAEQLKAGSDTGKVEITNGIFDSGEFENNTGSMSVLSSRFEELDLRNDTGDIYVEGSQTEGLQIECDTGDINLKKTRFTKAEFENDTGLIEALACIGKTVVGSNNTGNIQLQVNNSEQMDLETDTGSIKLALEGEQNDYNIDFKSDTGSLRLERGDYKNRAEIDNGAKRWIRMCTDTGNAEIDFISEHE